MTPDQQQNYNAVYPRLLELTHKEDLGEISDEELRELQRLGNELEGLMNQMSPYPPTGQN